MKDIAAIKRIADDNRHAVGVVLKARLESYVRQGEILVEERDGQIIGFITFHHRKDGWTTSMNCAFISIFRETV